MWCDLLKVKDLHLQGRSILLRRGKKKPDTGKTAGSDKPLGTTNPVLYELCEQKSISVAQVVSGAVTICHEPTGDITGWASICWIELVGW